VCRNNIWKLHSGKKRNECKVKDKQEEMTGNDVFPLSQPTLGDEKAVVQSERTAQILNWSGKGWTSTTQGLLNPSVNQGLL